MVLLDRRTDDAGHANPVATHFHDLGLALFVEERAIERFCVFGAQLEDVTHFDAAYDVEHALAIRRRIAGDHIADIGDFRLGEITAEIGAGQVHVHFIGAAGKVGHHGHRAVGDDTDARLDTDRADETGDATQCFLDLVFTREAEGADAFNLAGLDFVELMIAAQEQQDQTTMATLGQFRDDGQCFDQT